jgi:hypothetical protein
LAEVLKEEREIALDFTDQSQLSASASGKREILLAK